MKEKDLQETNFYHYSNLFNVEKDGDVFFFNLNNNIVFEEKPDRSTYTTYIPRGGDTWASISYKAYQTVRLWWFICRFNHITNPLKKPEEYEELKIPVIDFVNDVVNKINYNK